MLSHSKSNNLSIYQQALLKLSDTLLYKPTADVSSEVDKIRAMSLVDFCEHYLVIQDKQDRVVSLKLNKVQRHFAEHITSRNVILKARQVGISTVIQAYIFKRILSDPSRFVTMAHDDRTTAKLRSMAKLYYDKLPDEIQIRRKLDNAAITSYSNHSEVTISSAGSKEGGRGGTYGGGFHWSEVAFTTNAAEIVSGIMQGVPESGVVFLESSPNGAGGFFYNSVMKARNGESEYTLHFYPWWWNEEYQLVLQPDEVLTYTDEEQKLVQQHDLTPAQIKWRRKKQAEPGLVFKQEYPEDIDDCFVTSGESAFPLIHLAMIPQERIHPIAGHRHVAGLDWGQDNDYTSLSILDANDRVEVALERWRRLPYKVIRRNVIDLCRFWNVELIEPERNSMSTNIEDLIDDCRALNYEVQITPVVMSNLLKHELVTDFKKGYQEQDLKILNIPYGKQELNIFVKRQTPSLLWTYGAMTGKDDEGEDNHDDSVIARLLAWHGASQPVPLWGFSFNW